MAKETQSASTNTIRLQPLRLRLAEQTQEHCVQTQLEFGQFATSRRLSRQGVNKN